jgi:hypothetical protein
MESAARNGHSAASCNEKARLRGRALWLERFETKRKSTSDYPRGRLRIMNAS